ncbi:MAG: ribonuclease HI family protein [Candidatus Peregrinibacteria bacterium]
MIELFVDGGARGNPGPAGGGFVIFRNGKLVAKGKEFFGHLTNNQAEYLALRAALREAYRLIGDSPLTCHMDSELVVRQMTGEYKVRNAELKPLFAETRRIADQFKSFKIDHIPREDNYLADHLANQAMDEG